MLQNAFNFGTSSGSSISKLQNKVDKHPRTPTAWRDLATALEQKQRTQEAVNALERYTALRPKDQDALAELASQYGTLATNYANDYADGPAAEAEQESPASAFGPPSTTPFGKALASSTALQDPISAAVPSLAACEAADGVLGLPEPQRSAETAYQRLVEPEPEGRDVAVPARPGGAGRRRTRRPRSRPSRRSSSWRRTTRSRRQVRKRSRQLKAQAAAGASARPSG